MELLMTKSHDKNLVEQCVLKGVINVALNLIH